MTALVADTEVDVADVLDELGVDMTRARERGSWLDLLCPFHPEGNPSFSVSLDHGGWVDRHSGESGSLVSLVSQVLETGLGDAIQWLRARRVGNIETMPALLARLFVITRGDSEAAESLVAWSDVYDALDPKLMEQYFFDRGFSVETMRLFEVRYDPEDDSLMFPTRDDSANLTGFVRRRIDRGLPLGRKYLYPSGFRRVLYPLHLHRSTVRPLDVGPVAEAIIVEGPLDAMWLHQLGYTSAVALLGADATPDAMAWFHARVRRAILCFDNDESGRKSSRTLARRLVPTHDVLLANVPAGAKDVQELSSERVAEVLAGARRVLLPSDLG
jgi:DNA primase